jgi:hypothetical protein
MYLDAARLPRVLTVQGAVRLGVSRAHVRTQLERGRWQALARGVWLTRVDPPDRLDWALAGLAVAGTDSALTGWDAIRLYGLGSKVPPVSVVRVLTARGGNRRIGEVAIRPSARELTVRVLAADRCPDGIRVASPSRAVADTSIDTTSGRTVRAMVTQAIQRGLCSQDELVAELDAAPQNGSGHLRVALEDVRRGARSIAEAEAIELLHRKDIPPFEANAEIRDRNGRVVAVADILWRSLRAILEIDSREFHFGEQEWKQSMRRHNRLSAMGYAVVHYAPSTIRSGGQMWADDIASWLRGRAIELGLAS